MCDLSTEEHSSVWSQTFPLARKTHRCECCGATVTPGSRYCRTFIVFEGEADSSKSCLPCHREIQRFGKVHSFYPWPNQLTEYLEECVREEPDDSARWKAALRRIRERREVAP